MEADVADGCPFGSDGGGGDEGDEGEWDDGGEKEGEAFGDVVVPAVCAIKDCQGLGDVEVEPLVRWERPHAEIVVVRGGGDGEGECAVGVNMCPRRVEEWDR